MNRHRRMMSSHAWKHCSGTHGRGWVTVGTRGRCWWWVCRAVSGCTFSNARSWLVTRCLACVSTHPLPSAYWWDSCFRRGGCSTSPPETVAMVHLSLPCAAQYIEKLKKNSSPHFLLLPELKEDVVGVGGVTTPLAFQMLKHRPAAPSFSCRLKVHIVVPPFVHQVQEPHSVPFCTKSEDAADRGWERVQKPWLGTAGELERMTRVSVGQHRAIQEVKKGWRRLQTVGQGGGNPMAGGTAEGR